MEQSSQILILGDDDLSQDQKTQITQLNKEFFPENVAEGEYRFPKTPEVSKRFLYVVGSEIASHILVITRQIQYKGKSYFCGMVGEICTRRDFRRRGFAQALLKKVNNYLEEEKLCPGILFCRPEMQSFYEQVGWIVLDNRLVEIGVADHKRQPDGLTMIRTSPRLSCLDLHHVQEPVFFGESA